MGIDNFENIEKPGNDLDTCADCGTEYVVPIIVKELAPGINFHTADFDCPNCHSKRIVISDQDNPQ